MVMKLAYPYEEQRMQSFLRPLLSHTDAIGNWGYARYGMQNVWNSDRIT